MTKPTLSAVACAIVISMTIVFSGCTKRTDYDVTTHVEGTLKVRVEVDSTGDYSGFKVSVLTQKEGDVDTLGTTVTDVKGAFAMRVHALDNGVYPIVVERSGAVLSVGDIVIVDGDSVQVTGAYPLSARGLRIVSNENAAWSAYKNAKAGHNQQMLNLIRSEAYSLEDVRRVTTQTSTILWSIPATYPETIGGDISMAESIVMMEGWSDSTVLARLPFISPENTSIVEVVRAARRSMARVAGQDSAVALLDRYLTITPVEKHPGIMAEKVITYSDSLANEDAVRTALELKKRYPTSEWAAWAGRATYELENLQPGMTAPAFSLVTRDGVLASTSSVEGQFVILEFFDPLEQIFQRELEARDGIAGALDDRLFKVISISVEPDSVVNEALFDGASHPGQFVWLPKGMDAQIVKDFNVQILPTRFLLDMEGVIIAKYSGSTIGNLEQDLASIVTGLNGLANVPSDQ